MLIVEFRLVSYDEVKEKQANNKIIKKMLSNFVFFQEFKLKDTKK